MAIVLMEGFDHFAAGSQNLKGWTGFIFRVLPPRIGFNGQSVEIIANNQVTKILPSSYTTMTVGFGLKLIPNALWNGNAIFLHLKASGVDVCRIGAGAGYLEFLDAASRVWLGPPLVTNSWMYLELQLTVGSSETFDLHLNGASVITDTTADFGVNPIDRIVLDAAALCPAAFDDIYALDGTGGSPLDDFLGDVYVQTLYPRADGDYTDWTPLTGSDHFAMVDEHQIDGDGSYVYDTNVGDKDSYYLDFLSASTIYAAQLNVGARKGDGALRQIQPLIRQSATDYNGTTATLSTNYVFYSWLMGEDPTSSPWTDTTINGDQFGMEVIT